MPSLNSFQSKHQVYLLLVCAQDGASIVVAALLAQNSEPLRGLVKFKIGLLNTDMSPLTKQCGRSSSCSGFLFWGSLVRDHPMNS